MTRSGRTPKLARRRVEPAWSHRVEYIYTFGPEVADIAALAGLEPDAGQQEILDQTFGFRADGRPAAFEVDIIAPRQNIKTASIIMIELGWLYVTEEPFIIHSAHELDATEEAFIDLRARIEDTPKLAKWLDPTKGEKDHPGMYTGNGSWEIHLLGGTRLKYKARTKNAGRALTADKLVLDEGFALQPSMLGSLMPTMTTIPDAQVVTASSAGKLESAVLRDHRERGRAGSSPNQVYVEYGDRNAWKGCKSRDCDHAKTAVGCALDDEKRWARIMPAWGTRVFPETIRNMRQSMPPLEFAREFMVWWEDPPNGDEGQALNTMKWAVMANPLAKKPDRACVVLDVHPQRKSASIGIAADGTDGRCLVMTQTAPGISWVVPSLKKLKAKREITEVAIDPTSQASVLMAELDAAGIEYYKLTSSDMGQACASWIEDINGVDLEAVAAGDTSSLKLEHVGQPELDTAIPNAKTREVGEIEKWDARDRKIDISPVRATSAAAHRWRGSGQPPRSAYEDNDLLVL